MVDPTASVVVGRLVDLLNRQRIDGREVALFGRRIEPDGSHDRPGPPELLLRAVTDQHGQFTGGAPHGRFLEGFVLLSDGSGRIGIDLRADGTFPDEVVIFLNTLESHLRFYS